MATGWYDAHGSSVDDHHEPERKSLGSSGGRTECSPRAQHASTRLTEHRLVEVARCAGTLCDRSLGGQLFRAYVPTSSPRASSWPRIASTTRSRVAPGSNPSVLSSAKSVK